MTKFRKIDFAKTGFDGAYPGVSIVIEMAGSLVPGGIDDHEPLMRNRLLLAVCQAEFKPMVLIEQICRGRDERDPYVSSCRHA